MNNFSAFILCVQPVSWTNHTLNTVTFCLKCPFSPHRGLGAPVIWTPSLALTSCFAFCGALTPTGELFQVFLEQAMLSSDPRAMARAAPVCPPPDSFPQFLLILTTDDNFGPLLWEALLGVPWNLHPALCHSHSLTV